MNQFTHLKTQIESAGHFNVPLIESAFELAQEIHKDQKRKSGEPFIIHPLEVAESILSLGGDDHMICAALLHDVLEDAKGYDIGELENKIHQDFGSYVFFLVKALSKDNEITDPISQQEEYFVQIEEALSLDISVFFLKMADLLHNLKTIQALSPEKQYKWIQELKNRYIPMMQDHFHTVSFHYHPMYLNIINQMEHFIEVYENPPK